jgi:hypothetical protein
LGVVGVLCSDDGGGDNDFGSIDTNRFWSVCGDVRLGLDTDVGGALDADTGGGFVAMPGTVKGRIVLLLPPLFTVLAAVRFCMVLGVTGVFGSW